MCAGWSSVFVLLSSPPCHFRALIRALLSGLASHLELCQTLQHPYSLVHFHLIRWTHGHPLHLAGNRGPQITGSCIDCFTEGHQGASHSCQWGYILACSKCWWHKSRWCSSQCQGCLQCLGFSYLVDVHG